MRLFDFFRLNRRSGSTADTARQRLSVLVALDRKGGDGPDFLPLLQKELLQVIRKYVEVEEDKVNLELKRGDDFSTLEVNVELPNQAATRAAM